MLVSARGPGFRGGMTAEFLGLPDARRCLWYDRRVLLDNFFCSCLERLERGENLMTKVRGSLSWIVHAVGMGAVAVGGTARVTTEVAGVRWCF